VAELNRLARTSLDDPEAPANRYKIVVQGSKKNPIVFDYADRVQFGGKIDTDQSSEKGTVWSVTEQSAGFCRERKESRRRTLELLVRSERTRR